MSDRKTESWQALMQQAADALRHAGPVTRELVASRLDTRLAQPEHDETSATRGGYQPTSSDLRPPPRNPNETTCSLPSPSDNQESAFAFVLSLAADKRFSNEYLGNVVRSWLHVLDGSSTPEKTSTERPSVPQQGE